MKRLWTIIGVADVAKGYAWYQTLLDLPRNKPHHSCFGQLVDKDGTVLLCVHEWGVEDHPPLSDPKADKPGNGLLLFFRADNFETALAAARGLGTLEQAPSRNENTGTMEFSLRDPDGYFVSISAND